MRIALAVVVSVVAAGVGVIAIGPSGAAAATTRAPVVLFPAFHFTKLQATVTNQTAAPDCPASGTFQDWFGAPQDSPFNQVCRDKLLTLKYNDSHAAIPMAHRFSEQPGVNVSIVDYGKTSSAPFYEDLYKKLEAQGYTRDKDIRVAGYDSRLTPDMGGFLNRTINLIQQTYAANGNQKVELVAHSNGPLYAQYLLTHVSQAWKDKYIHGFTAIAGNFPGQGLVYSVFFTGLNTEDFSYPTTVENAQSSARMFLSAPSSYMSSADPAIFGDQEVVVQDLSTNKSYTPEDYPQLFADAGLPDAAKIASAYIGFVKFHDPSSFPNVDVHADKGSGLPTTVGAKLDNLTVGQLVPSDRFLSRDGDTNQEDITNAAVGVWQGMTCHHFSLTDHPGVDHFSLPSNTDVLNELVTTLTTNPVDCTRGHGDGGHGHN